MARVFTLASGSSGNCAFIGDAHGGLLIDIGISFLKVKTALENEGIGIEKVEALLITHEHSDHIKGLETFCKKTDIPIYSSAKTAEYIENSGVIQSGRIQTVSHGEAVSVGMSRFCPFNISHDAAQAFGYRITTADSREVVYSTDIGCVDDETYSYIRNADLNIIEANYDEGMLMCNVSYSFLLRKRIAGDCGHLSNKDCAKIAVRLVSEGAKRLVLAHLSEQNNTPQIAYESVMLALTQDGFRRGVDFELEVAPRHQTSKVLVF